MTLTCEHIVHSGPDMDPGATIDIPCGQRASTIEIVRDRDLHADYLTALCPEHAEEAQNETDRDTDQYRSENTEVKYFLVLEYTAPNNDYTQVLGVAGQTIVAYAPVDAGVQMIERQRIDPEIPESEQWVRKSVPLPVRQSGFYDAVQVLITEHLREIDGHNQHKAN